MEFINVLERNLNLYTIGFAGYRYNLGHRILELVEIHVPDLHETPFGHKRHGVQRLLHLHRVQRGTVDPLVAEIILPFREASFFQLPQILLPQIVLLAPEEIKPLRSPLLERAKLCSIIERFFVFSGFLSHCSSPDGFPPFRPHPFA